MAASKTVYQLPQSHNSLTPRHGVVTLSGHGIRVCLDRGHLLLEGGSGPDRHTIRLPRVRHGLKRLVIIGSDGFISLAALRWLSDQHAAFIMLERDGKVLAVTGPVYPSDARLRRAQALAHQSGAALEIARKLIEVKVSGQESLVRNKLKDSAAADMIARFRERLPLAESVEIIRTIEAHAAGAYWNAWRNVPILFPKIDQSRVPVHWKFFGTRASPLTGSPRLAVTPPCAILNYCYALLESETRLAASAVGLDPGIGMLHVDTPNRDSLACDIMEAGRASVDAWLLDWITREPLRRSAFFEVRNGNCRLMGTFAAKLSETAPTWGKLVAPWAEWVAQTLWNSIRKPVHKGSILPTRLTQRRRSEGRGNEFVLNAEPAPHPENVCCGCGATTRSGRHCSKCGREISTRKLIELAKVGRMAAQSPESRKKHSETQRQHEAAKRAWRSSPKPDWPDENAYVTQIQPRLSAVTISALASTLRISEPYAAHIRAGRHRPHPRHWMALAKLAAFSPHT
jgi:CRISPR-associated endonuclease Cas1